MNNLFEEGEPTNSVSNGGIDNTETPLKSKVVKRKKKKIKGFKEHLIESTLYRGHSPDYPMLGGQAIVWFSTKLALAIDYVHSSGLKSTDLTISSITYSPKKPFNAGRDHRVLNVASIVDDMMIQAKPSPALINKVKPLYDKMFKFYGTEEHSIITYWNGDNDYFSEMLDKLGFDSIKLTEKSTTTYGILRKYINNKKGKLVEL